MNGWAHNQYCCTYFILFFFFVCHRRIYILCFSGEWEKIESKSVFVAYTYGTRKISNIVVCMGACTLQLYGVFFTLWQDQHTEHIVDHDLFFASLLYLVCLTHTYITLPCCFFFFFAPLFLFRFVCMDGIISRTFQCKDRL